MISEDELTINHIKRMGRQQKQRHCTRMLSSAATVGDCPEKDLVVAVLDQAGQDLAHSTERFGARNFLGSRVMATYCNLIGLDPAYARGILQDFYEPAKRVA